MTVARRTLKPKDAVPNVSSVRPLRAVPALVLATLAACHGDGPNKPPNLTTPASVSVTAGNNQTGLPGAPLATPVSVQVLNAQNSPLANSTVTFSVVTGSGSVASATSTTVTTDADGKAQTTWVLGEGSVRQLLQAKAGNATARLRAVVDTSRVMYLSVRDTVAVGDTIRVWTAVGLENAPGEAWGSAISVLNWGDTNSVRLTYRLAVADPSLKFFSHIGATGTAVASAASLPTNSSGSATGGPRMFGIDFVVKPAAKGKDVQFTLGATALVGARTFTNLRTSVGVVGATVHVQ